MIRHRRFWRPDRPTGAGNGIPTRLAKNPNRARLHTHELRGFLKRHAGGPAIDKDGDLLGSGRPAAAEFLDAQPSPWRLPSATRFSGYRCAGSPTGGLGAADGTGDSPMIPTQMSGAPTSFAARKSVLWLNRIPV